MDDDRLFLERLSDLQTRIERGQSEYRVLDIAFLLRNLILDRDSLMDKANRRRGVRIRFIANGREPVWQQLGEPPPVFWSMEDGFDPDSAFRAVPVELTIHDLLQRVVMVIDGVQLTVKDVIRQNLYAEGGAHPGREPDSEKERSLATTGIYVGGYPAQLSPLLAIGRVVTKGLEPLQRRVEADLKQEGSAQR